MKKALKYFFAVFAAVIFCLALAACGESAGTKYTFKETKVTTDLQSGSTASAITSLETMYNTTYKDSTLEVKDGKIVWKIGDMENAMTYTKDGDKYVLAGEYMEQLSSAFSSFGGVGSISYYGQKTEDGFAIVMEETFTDNPVMSNVTFTFNFIAA